MEVSEAAAASVGITVEPTGQRCARCGRDGATTPASDVVSRSFVGYDDWAATTGLVCPVCAWAYAGDPGLRVEIREISRDPAAMRVLSPWQAYQVLCAGPIPMGRAIVVPVRPGRKHVLPLARWGRVGADDVSIAWGTGPAQLLELVGMLRQAGVSAPALREPAPPFQVVQRAGAGAGQVLRAWEQLRVWRSPRNPWMAVAIRVTTSIKEKLG